MNKKYSVDEAITQMITLKNAIIVVITMVIFVAAGLLIRGGNVMNTSYKAVSKLQVTQYDENDKEIVLNNSDPAFLNTYVEILKTNKTQKQTAQELKKEHLKISAEKVSSMVNLEWMPQTTLIKISTSGSNKKNVKKVNSAFTKVALKQYKAEMNTGSVKVVDIKFSKDATPAKMSLKKVVFFTAVLGIFIAVLIIFLINYFNQKIVSTKFITDRTATEIIAAGNKNDLTKISADLAVKLKNKYQKIGFVVSDQAQSTFITELVDELVKMNVFVKLLDNDSLNNGKQEAEILGNDLVFVIGKLDQPRERLVLAEMETIVDVVTENISLKDQLLETIEFAKDADIPFSGSIYLK